MNKIVKNIIQNIFKKMFYYPLNYKIVRVNLIVFLIMLCIYTSLFFINQEYFFYIEEIKDATNFKLINSFYFTCMIHTHVAIGDIVPINWLSKVLVSLHIIIVFSTTSISLVDDFYDTVQEYHEGTQSNYSNDDYDDSI